MARKIVLRKIEALAPITQVYYLAAPRIEADKSGEASRPWIIFDTSGIACAAWQQTSGHIDSGSPLEPSTPDRPPPKSAVSNSSRGRRKK